MTTLELLQEDHARLTELLQARRAVSIEEMQTGERIAWQMYLAILADALSTLDSLIEHLEPNANGDERMSP